MAAVVVKPDAATARNLIHVARGTSPLALSMADSSESESVSSSLVGTGRLLAWNWRFRYISVP